MIYFEEVMLQGIILGYIRLDFDEIVEYIDKYVKKIDNWFMCDNFCKRLKYVNKHKERWQDYIQKQLFSSDEFEIRFGVVIIIYYYIENNYIDNVLEVLNKIDTSKYYASTAVAWALSICYVKFSNETLEYLKRSNIDDITYNRTIQKIVESFQVEDEEKQIISKMKREYVNKTM